MFKETKHNRLIPIAIGRVYQMTIKSINNYILKTDSSNIIEASEADYLYTQTSQLPNSGMGLYTAITIYKDEIISLFKGEQLTIKQAANRIQKGKDQYFINMLDGSIMDSMHIACYAKFANDAEGYTKSNFKNNSKITLDENQNVCLIATRNIKSGLEIFCGYGKAYWKKHG